MGSKKKEVYGRFQSKTKLVESGCIEWQSTIKKDGYGSFHLDGKQVPAHRVAMILLGGGIPEGMHVLHKCDNRRCVNVEHLFLGTTADNVRDMDEKKRRGTKAKLTLKQAEEIRSLLEQRYSQFAIAKMYGVDQTTISRVKLGITKLYKE